MESGEAGAGRGPEFSLMAPAGTVLRQEGREMTGTESNHQEFLKKFPIQALSESDFVVRFCPAISHPSSLRTVDILHKSRKLWVSLHLPLTAAPEFRLGN